MKKSFDREYIFSSLMIAILVAISVVFLILSCFEINLDECNLTLFVGSFAALTGAVWCFLLCRNC